MPQYDGSIRINAEIDAKNVNSQMMRVVNSIRKTEAEVSRLRSKMKELEVAKIPTQEYTQLQKDIEKASVALDKLNAKKAEMESQKVPTEQYSNLLKNLEKAETEYTRLLEQAKSFEAIGAPMPESLSDSLGAAEEKVYDIKSAIESLEKSGGAFTNKFDLGEGNAEKLKQDIAAATAKVNELKAAMSQMETSGKAFTSGIDTEEYARAAERVRELNGNIEESKLRLSELKAKQGPITNEFNRIKASAKKAFSEINSGAKKSNISLSGGLKTILKYGFGIRSIYVLFNKIRNGIKESFSNLMEYSSDFANSVQGLKNSLGTLGNQFAAAFAPIVQMVIPWLTSLINAISTAMTYVAQFIAILGGKSTFTRAKQVQDGYNKSLGSTASAAKKAYGALAKFDDLDVLQKQEDSGSGAGAEAAGNLFEEVPVDSKFKEWLDGILEKLKPILEYAKKLKDIFMQGFWDGLGDYEYRFEAIKNGLEQIKKAAMDIWNDPSVREAADEWAQSVAYMLGSLVGSAASISLTVAAAFIGGLGQYLENNVERIKRFLVSAFEIKAEINYLLADLFQTVAYIFEAFASESGIRFMSALIGSIADASMGIIELSLKLGRDFMQMLILPITQNADGFKTALEGLLSVGATVLETFKESIDKTFDKINEVYDKHFKPFFDSVANGLSELVGKFLDFWNGKVQPVLENMADGFKETWESSVQPVIDHFIELFGKVADLLKALWENVLVPFIGWIIDNILPLLLPVIQTLWDNFLLFVEFICEAIDSLIEIFGGFIDFLTGVFSGDWELAFSGLCAILEGFQTFIETVWNAIKTASSTIWNEIKTVLQTTWENIKAQATETWTAIKNWFFTVLENIKTKASEIWEKIRLEYAEKMNAIKEKTSDIIDKFDEFKDNVSEVFQNIKETISETIGSAIDKLSDFIGKIRDAIQAVKDFLASGFEKISGAVGSIFGGGSSGASTASYSVSAVSYSISDIPALASGSVIRGGNPFLALLGDQPAGQTNIEAPLSTIEQALENVMNRNGYGGDRIPVNINVQYDGQTFARLSLDDILAEANRRGYDVSVLGVT